MGQKASPPKTGVTQWRLLEDAEQDGAWNMALDRAIQISHARGESPPTLRLYRWLRPTVTIGRFQSPQTVDLGECRRAGVDVVRRFTGGRGVLHSDEMTYCVVAGERDGIPRGVAASYRMLCSALARAYHDLGVPAELTARPRGPRDSAACYLHATHADLSVGAAKLSGSAQVWFEGTCMQHGSLVRSRDLSLEATVFRLGEDEKKGLGETTTTLAEVRDDVPDDAEISSAVIRGFDEALGIRFAKIPISDAERSLARTLMKEVQVNEPE